MAEVNRLNVRICHKRATSAELTQSDPVLLDGEIIIVDTANGEVRTKTGDGVTAYSKLPFDDEAVRNLVNSKAAKSDLEELRSELDTDLVAITNDEIDEICNGTDVANAEAVHY